MMGGEQVCRQFTPLAVSRANLLLSSQESCTSRFWMVDQSEPLAQYSSTMAKLGGLVQAPRNITMLGCRRAYIAAHSLKKSLTAPSDSILNILIATTVSLHRPLQMIPQPPSEIWLSKTSSLKSISMLQLNILGCTPSWSSMFFSSVPQRLVRASLLEEPPFFCILYLSSPGSFYLCSGGLMNLSYSVSRGLELSRKVIPFPTIKLMLSLRYRGIFNAVGAYRNESDAVPAIWPNQLEPQPQKALFSEIAKKLLYPPNICLMLDSFSRRRGVQEKNFSPFSLQIYPSWYTSPFLVKKIADFQPSFISTIYSETVSWLKPSIVLSPKVPQMQALPPEMQPREETPASILSIL